MKKQLHFFWCTALLCASLLSQAQQWERTIGPTGSWIWNILPAGNALFAGTSQGLFKSTDQGITWNIDSSGVPVKLPIRGLAKKGQILLAGTHQGIYRSTNGGASWSITNFLGICYGLVANDQVFLMQDYDGYTYTSSDGNSWQACEYSGNRIGRNGNTLYIANGIRLMRSVDNGSSWTQVYSQQGGYNCIGGDGQVLLVSAVQGGYLRSTNDGASFTAISSGLPPTGATGMINTSAFHFRGDTIFAGLYANPHEIYLSTDNGLNWRKHSTAGIKVPATCFYEADGYMLAGATSGMFRSTDRGATWVFNPNQGINNTTVKDMHIRGNDWFFATGSSSEFGTSHSFYHSGDGARTYSIPDPLAFSNSSNSKLITGIDSVLLLFNNFTLFRSTNSGASWSTVLNADFSPTCFFVNGTRIFAGTYFNGLWISDDLGLNWTRVLPSTVSVNGITRLNGTLYISTNGSVRKSTDGGLTWSVSGTGIPGTNTVLSVAANNQYLFATALSAAYSDIYRSADQGNTWQKISAALPSGRYQAMAVRNDTIVVGTDEPGVDFINTHLYRSTDLGNTWQRFNAGMYVKSDITFLKFAGDVLLAGTESAGLWKMNLNIVLPVKLLKFEANPQPNREVLLRWSTTGETGFSHFEVESSVNGTAFTRLGTVAAGDGPYTFRHQARVSGLLYFRLRMVDRDGRSSYSPVKTIRVTAENPVRVFPNPAHGQVTIQARELSSWQLADVSGKIWRQQKRASLGEQSLNLQGIPAGLYLLTLTDAAGTVHTEKLLVQ